MNANALKAFGEIANFQLAKNPIPVRGSRVRIIAGKHANFEGKVMWVGTTYTSRNRWNRGRNSYNMSGKLLEAIGYDVRLGIDLDNGQRVFIDFYDNVKTL